MPKPKKDVSSKDKKEVASKPKDKKTPAKSKIELISYEMGMTIPTGQYANIMPRVVVKGGDMEAAHDFIAPHMNKLWKEYYLCNERRVEPPTPKPEPITTPVATPATGTGKGTIGSTDNIGTTGSAPIAEPEANEPVAVEPAPASSVAMTKATQAIESCMSDEALNLIIDQVEKSEKLTNADKDLLIPMASEKFEKSFKK